MNIVLFYKYNILYSMNKYILTSQYQQKRTSCIGKRTKHLFLTKLSKEGVQYYALYVESNVV